jgi:hypothetical protein
MWHVWERREPYRVLVGKFVGKRQPSRPRYRWNDYIKLDLTGNKMKGRGLD